MIKESINFDILQNQRHFHFIVMRDINGYNLPEYWRQAGKVVPPSQNKCDFKSSEFEIQHRRIISDIPYSRGKMLDFVSVAGDGSAPYWYDVFALKMLIDSNNYFAFAFPFSTLARDVIDKLITKHKIQRTCDILKVDLPVLVRKIQQRSEIAEIRAQIVGLQVIILDDPNLSSLSLEGDDPLKSTMYQDFLQMPIRDGDTTLKNCVLACELEQSALDTTEENQRKIRARMHIDAFGNFKFYVHSSGENIIIVPSLVKLLNYYGALNNVSINPLHRADEE